jgi:hypothetical protein
VSTLEIPDGSEKVNPAKIWPQGLSEVELAVRALPKQEAAEALFTRGSDKQVRIWLATGIEILGNEFRCHKFGKLLNGAAA